MSTDVKQPEYERDSVSGARVLVGDMLMWSDLESLRAPLAAREVVRAIVADRRPERVLLAGARAGLLVDVLPTDLRVDFLVRAMPDARILRVKAGLHNQAEIWCGGLDVFDSGHDYDLVVALGGPERLLGPDSHGMTDDEVLHALGSHVADGGILVADLANALGVNDLVTAVPDVELESDSAWHLGAAGFAHRHLYAVEREPGFEAAGLHVLRTYAALPSLDHHQLLVSETASLDPATRGDVAVRCGRAMDSQFAETPLLRDQYSTLSRIVDAQLLDELAPAWLVVTGKGSSVTAPTLPDLVDAEPGLDAPWSVIDTVAGDGSVVRAWSDGRADHEVSEAKIKRTLAVPTRHGRSLELRLRQACATRRHAAIRACVRSYAEWLKDNHIWTRETAERRIFATPANVLIDGTTLALADSSWTRAGIISAEDSLIRGLRDFSRRLLATGSAHPWRVTITPDELTLTLAAMAGVTVTAQSITVAARIESEVASAVSGHPEDFDTLFEQNIETGRHARDLPAPDRIGYRELLTHDRAISRDLREVDAQIAWLEGTLRHRDRYIRQLERAIEKYEGTLTYRAVESMRAPRRIATEKAVSAAKDTAREVLPPGAMSKARQLASRVLK